MREAYSRRSASEISRSPASTSAKPETIVSGVIGFAEILAGPRPLSDEDRRDHAERVLSAAMEIREMIDTAKFD